MVEFSFLLIISWKLSNFKKLALFLDVPKLMEKLKDIGSKEAGLKDKEMAFKNEIKDFLLLYYGSVNNLFLPKPQYSVPYFVKLIITSMHLTT